MHLSVSESVLPCNMRRHVFCYTAAAKGSEIRNKTHQKEKQQQKKKSKDRAQSHKFGVYDEI